MNPKVGEVIWKCEMTHQKTLANVYRDLDTGTAYICENRPAGSGSPYIELPDYRGGTFFAMVVPDGFGPEKELGWDGILR